MRSWHIIYATRIEEHYEVLAHHYEKSDNALKAIHCLMLAGEKSNNHMIAESASEFFTRALKVADEAKVSLDIETETRIQYGLGLACFAMGAVNTAVESLRRSIELARAEGLVEYEIESRAQLSNCL